ncbi:hypothetical protein Hanom_Chr11g00985241 [Helianthus anomalus]
MGIKFPLGENLVNETTGTLSPISYFAASRSYVHGRNVTDVTGF